MRQSMEVFVFTRFFPRQGGPRIPRSMPGAVHTWNSEHYSYGPVYLVFICYYGLWPSRVCRLARLCAHSGMCISCRSYSRSQLLAVQCVRLSLSMRTSAYRSRSLPAASIRTQTRPAIEFDSGEEGLRPESYHIVFSFLEYLFTDTRKYVNAPGPIVGQRGDGDDGASPRSACERYVRCALPVCSLCLIMFSFPQCRLIIDRAGSNGLR